MNNNRTYAIWYLIWFIVACAIVTGMILIGDKAGATELLQGNYYNGYTEDNYTYKDGLFYRGDVAYSRERVSWTEQVPYYNGYGGYSYTPKTYYRWRYVRVQYPTPTVPTYSKDWQGKLLDIAANRDKVEGKLRESSLDHQAYLSAVQALGLQGNFHWNGYGNAPVNPNYSPGVPSNPALGSYGAQGNTLYGYSYSSVKDLYGDTNLGVLYQQAARLTQNAQTLAGQAHGDFSDLVGREGSNRARVAEILAKSQAAAAALTAANPQPSTHTESRVFSFRAVQGDGGDLQLVPVDPGQAPQGVPGAMPRAEGGNGADFAALLQSRCAECHAGNTVKGGFDIRSYATLSPKDKAARVWSRLTTTNVEKRMPLGKPALTAEELRLFFSH